MNLATMTAAPTTVTVGEKQYRIGPFRYLELGCVQRYLDETYPERTPQIGDDRWASVLLATIDGVGFFLNLLFSRHQPDFSTDDLAEVMGHVGPKQIGPLFAIAMEEDPKVVDREGDDAPKGEAAAPTT